ANIDYTAEAVVKVTAQNQGDSTRSDVIYTTTNVIHDVPILYVDDDGQHADQPRKSYNGGSDGQFGPETDEINIGALEVNYKGQYHHIELEGDNQPYRTMDNQGASGPPYDSSHGISPYTVDSKRVYLKDYDVVIWDTGYSETLTASGSSWDGSGETHAWYDQSELMTYLKNGGALIWLNNKGTEWHDQQAGWYTNPFYTDYFKADRCIQQGGLTYQIVGVTDDPVGNGVNVENSFIYSLVGDRSDAITPKSGAHGVYYAGKGYTTIRYEHPRESSSNQRFKTILQTKNWAHFGDYNDYDHPMRVRSVTQSMTWLGAPPTNAPEYDLGIESIESPYGEYVNPGDSIPLEVMVRNTGQKNVTTQFSVIFKVKDMDNNNNTVFQKTVDVNEDLNATKEMKVSTWWNTNKPVSGHHYNVTFEISYGSDGNSDNNEMYTHQEAKEAKDITILEANYEKSTFYWNATRIGDPTEVWAKVKNIGSVDATFTVDLKIMSPLHTEVFSKTTTIEDLAPGREKKVSWIWTPRNPAGYLTDWHFAVKRREHEDAYDAQFKVNYAGDDNTSNNEKGIGTDLAPGIVVMAYYDGSEPRQMTEDWVEVDLSGHDNHGDPENESTPIHLQSYAYATATHAWAVGYGDEGGELATIKPDWNTVAISPKIDLKNYTKAGANWLIGGRSGAGTFYLQISRDYDGNPAHVESASWSTLQSWSGSSNTYGWYIPTSPANLSSYVGYEVCLRLRFVSDSDGGTCGPFADEIAIAG
ncbi:MAG: hypothetical protein KAU14_00425, partial [Thermoplasmata archaeon]|nr:hypothetical protein [Thermoplasmata archaeon]